MEYVRGEGARDDGDGGTGPHLRVAVARRQWEEQGVGVSALDLMPGGQYSAATNLCVISLAEGQVGGV